MTKTASIQDFFKKCISTAGSYRSSLTWELSRSRSSGFEPVTTPFPFPERGEYWFRSFFQVPETIRQIPVTDSAFRLRCFMTLPTQVYIDGEKVFDEKYWTDFQMPEVTVTEKAELGKSYEILVRVICNDSLEATGEKMEITLFSEVIEGLIFEIESFIGELQFIRYLPELTKTKDRVESFLTGKISPPPAFEDLPDLISRARTFLEQASPVTKSYTSHLIGHAHMDINWLWPQEETERMVQRDFSTIDKLMGKYPDFNLTQSQAELLEIAREKYPGLFKKIQKRVAENRIELADSSWVEGDLNMADGEAVSRHIKYSRQFNRDHFGKAGCLLWEPDTFGHPAAIPEIMRKSGLCYYYHYRLGPKTPLYRWRKNGSVVTAYSSIYINPVDPVKIIDSVCKIFSDTGSSHSVFVFGVGDHGGGPTARDIERARYLDNLPGMPRIVFSKMSDFFKAAEETAASIPEVSGEQNPIFSGCYTTHARTKVLNRRAESLLQLLERAFVLRQQTDPFLFPQWRKVMVNQFHDIICGCGIAETYRQTDRELEDLCRGSVDVLDTLLGNDADGTLGPAVWNLERFYRKDAVSIPSSRIYSGPAGQIYNKREYFCCESRPFSFCRLSETRGDDAENFVSIEEKPEHITLRSKYFKMMVHKESGTIHELVGLQENISYIAPVLWRDLRYNMWNNCFQLDYEAPHPMSAWIIGRVESTDYLISGAEVNVVSSGKVMTVLEIKHSFGVSELREEIFFYNDLPWIDFNIHVDWKELGGPDKPAPMLRLNFMPELDTNGKGTWEIPFGWIVRRTDGTDFPALRWIDVSDHEKGFTLVNNGTYGYNIQGNTIRANLIRSSYGPDPDPDRGTHSFGFRLIPHAGPLDPPAAYRHGIAFNRPLIPVNDSRDIKGSQKPIAAIDNDGMVLSSFHPDDSHDHAGIIRIVEYRGSDQDFTVFFGKTVSEVQEISIGEDILFRDLAKDNSMFRDTAGPFEIKTYRVIWKD